MDGPFTHLLLENNTLTENWSSWLFLVYSIIPAKCLIQSQHLPRMVEYTQNHKLVQLSANIFFSKSKYVKFIQSWKLKLWYTKTFSISDVIICDFLSRPKLFAND